MPDRLPDPAAARFLIAECTQPGVDQRSSIGATETDRPGEPQMPARVAALEIELGAKVRQVIQQGMDLGILDQQGRLQVERLVARGLLDSNGQVVQDIFGRRLPCQP